MSRQFLLPDLGEGLTEAEIVAWLVAPGDTVAVDQPVVEVESAKSVVELPSPFAGIVAELHAIAGQNVKAGEPLISIADAAAETPPQAPAPEPAAETSGAVLVGYGVPARKRTAGPAPRGRFGGRSNSGPAPATTPAGPSPVVSPLVRKLARDHGFNARDLTGSGPGSLVLRSDVESHIAELARPDVTATPVARPIPPSGADVRIPLSGVRKLTAEKMAASRREIPEATIWLDVDATALIETKEYLQASTGERWSVNALLARFVVAGLKRYPILNSSVDTAAGEIVQHGRINLGLAAQTPRGLMVPVLEDAGSLTTDGLRARMGALVEQAKTGAFPAGTLTGGTFTLNNYGGFGVDGSAAIINHPEVAILGIGRIIDRPWVVDGQLAVRKVVVLSLVFDHRVCDGDIPSQFITFIAACIQNPLALLPDL